MGRHADAEGLNYCSNAEKNVAKESVKATLFTGNYTEYEQDLKRRIGDDALNPKRVKYKKI